MTTNKKEAIRAYLDSLESSTAFSTLLEYYLDKSLKSRFAILGLKEIRIHVDFLEDVRIIGIQARYCNYYIDIQIDEEEYIIASDIDEVTDDMWIKLTSVEEAFNSVKSYLTQLVEVHGKKIYSNDTWAVKIVKSKKATCAVGLVAIVIGLLMLYLNARGQISYENGGSGFMFFFGIFIGLLGGLLIFYTMGSSSAQAKEEALADEKNKLLAENGSSAYLRPADMSVKSRIFLEVNRGVYSICYRRVKSTNELVINGYVYDEKKGILEFAHNLFAVIDGHRIEAGFDGACSYIRFDGKLVKERQRVI